MQTPLFQGKHSGRPQLYQGTSAGRRGSGFTGGQHAMPTKVVTNTLGWMSNYVINYAYVVRRFKDNSDQALNIGQYTFIRRRAYPLGDTRLQTICNVVQLNSLLRNLADRRQAPYNDQEGGDLVINEWAPLGVVCTEVGYDVKAESGEQQPQERLINATVRGRVQVFNQWGKQSVRDGTTLFFILEWCKSDGGTVREELILNKWPLSKSKKTPDKGYWRFRAYANHKYLHPYLDPDEVSKHGSVCGEHWFALYIGKVSSRGYLNTHGDDKHTAASHNDVNRLVTLPKYEIFADSINMCPEYIKCFASSKRTAATPAPDPGSAKVHFEDYD